MSISKIKSSVKYRFLILIPISILSSVIIYHLLTEPSEPDRTELELYFKASEAYEAGNLELCIKLTEALSKGNSSFFQSRMLYSKALFFCSRFDEAAETLESLLTDYKHYTEAEIWLVRTHIQLENVAEAKLLGEEVLSRSPEDPRILGLLARISYIEDDYQRALEYYGKAILFEEELAINRIELAKIYSALLNPEQARVQLERSLILLSNDSPLRSGIRLLLEQESTGAFQ